MSVQAISWVLEHSPTQGTDRLVLIALANHAGAEPEHGAWESWPGVERIGREAGLARKRTTQEALARLEAAGHIERVLNGAPDERIPADRRPNLYRVLTGVPSADTPRGDAPAGNGVPSERATGCREAAPKPSVNRQQNLGVVPQRATVTAFDPDPMAGFDAFWAAYPRKDDKARARKAWPRAVAAAAGELSVIIEGAARYRDDPNLVPQFTKQPATWLNAGSWENGPLPARDRRQPRGRSQQRVAERRNGQGRVVQL